MIIIIIRLTGLNEDTKKEFPAFAEQVLILYRWGGNENSTVAP